MVLLTALNSRPNVSAQATCDKFRLELDAVDDRMSGESIGDRISTRLSENSGANSLIAASMAWMDPLYDAEAGLLRYPDDTSRHMVRESLWYALGLVLESRFLDKPDSPVDRVGVVVRRVLDNQYRVPGSIWHGTFKRAPQEADPPADATVWKDYDPNWRQFIGTVLLLLRRLEGDGLLAALLPEIERALIKCIEGEPVDRVPPTYTNIALMRAWLEIECGDLFDKTGIGSDIRVRGLAYAHDIRQAFGQHHAFPEYNSPTYYGINFFALGLWQNFSTALASMGEEISTKLWTDVSRYYHAGMKNLCGPWSRSYGMDMQQYVAALGLWIWAATNREAAPFPVSTNKLAHAHDFCLGPIAAFSAVSIPAAAKENFLSVGEPRAISQQISTTPSRTANAYLSEKLMIGLETSNRSFRGTEQYHPLTIHWLDANGGVNWCRLRFKGSLAGELQENRILLRLKPDDNVTSARFEFSDDVQLIDQCVLSNNLSMQLDSTSQFQANERNLTMNFPGLDNEHSVTITCQLNQ